jgi:serine/threonine protein kinase/TolB-like protein/Flp pilus assembly protein TadD
LVVELKDWERLENLFHEALLVEAPRRDAFLSEACSDSEALRSEVESLISAYERDQGFLEQPAISLGWKLLSDRPQESLAGQSIGQYKVVRLLGAGGAGQVYLAEDDRLERPVALKFLASRVADGEWGREQLTKEARAVAKLEHPNICAVHGIEEIDGHRFIVMQYVEGETLSSVLHNDPPDTRRALSLAEQMAGALASAHARGIIHRDIKPQNVVVTPGGVAKILDFGLAKLTRQPQDVASGDGDLNRTIQLGLIVGTIAYMSPEQSQGDELDCRSDIFSFGIVLYEMLAGVNPFRRDSGEETIAAIREYEPPPLAIPTCDILPELDRLVGKCLEKTRERRYQTTDELLRDLRRLRERLEGKARVEESPERRKRRRLYALTALALVLLLAASVAFVYRRLNRVRTLAVLHVATEVGDSDWADVGMGLSRSLSYRLSRLSRLQVKTPKEASIAESRSDELALAGRELGVDALMVNRIERRGDALFLRASLLNASDGTRLWEEEFPTSKTDLTTLLNRVTQSVASRMNLQLNREDREFLAKRQTKDPEALELYLRGENYLNKRDQTNVRKAIDCFSQAIERDWVFAEAHAGLAESYLLLTTVAYGPEKTSDVIAMARASARQALKSDPTLSEAHTALGIINLRYEWNWQEAEKELREAIELNPDYAPAHYWYSSLLIVLRRNDEAIAQSEVARELEPFSPIMQMNVGRAFYYARRYEEAAERLSATLEKDENNTSARYMQALVYLARGKYAEGIDMLEKLYSLRPLYAAAPLGYAYGKAGREAEALAVLDRLDELSKDRPVPAQERAIIYIGLNNKDKAFMYLEEAYRERFSSLNSLTTEPLFDDLRSDPRYADLARRLNLKP